MTFLIINYFKNIEGNFINLSLLGFNTNEPMFYILLGLLVLLKFFIIYKIIVKHNKFKRIENELNHNKKLVKTLSEVTDEFYILCKSPNHEIITIDNKLINLLNINNSEINSLKTLSEKIFNGDDKIKFNDFIQRINLTNENNSEILNLINSKSEIIPFLVKAKLITTSEDNSNELIITFNKIDIKGNINFNEIVDSVFDAIILTDLNDVILYTNPAVTKIYGYTRNELIGKVAHKIFIEETQWEKMLNRMNSRKEGISESYEILQIRKDGTKFWSRIKGAPYKDFNNNIIGSIGTVSDLSRWELEEERYYLFENLISNSMKGVLITNPLENENPIIYVNNKFEEITGLKSNEVIGSKDIFPLNDKPENKLLNKIKEAIKNRKESDVFVKNENSEIWNEFKYFPLITENGTATHYVGIISDVTERYTKELQLIESKEKAEDLVKNKAVFLANMSHEIRTPMNGIIGMINLLYDTSLDEEQKEYVAAIKESGEVLLTIINDILDYSKIEAGKIAFENIEIDFRSLIENTLELFAKNADEKKIDLSYSISDDVPKIIKGDPVRIRQIISNLISNAIKFTPKGFVFVNVQSDLTKPEFIKFDVEDSGIGISEEGLKKLFTSYNQETSSTSRKYGGTGLGLAISKKLVSMMEGEIWVTTELNKGTVFSFTIKVNLVDNYETNYPNLENKKILIISNYEKFVKVLKEKLSKTGVKIKTENNIKLSFDLINESYNTKEEFSFIIIDNDLNEMNGAESIKLIEENFENLSSKIIVIGYKNSLQKIRKNNHIFFSKPIRYEKFFNILSDINSQTKEEFPSENIQTNNGEKIILVAEDNVISQKVASNYLKKLNYIPLIASNGNEVIEILMKEKVDLIFMDCQMPVMDGFETTKEIRNLPSSKSRIPIIAMTANLSPGEKEFCIKSGMNDYISKPVTPEKLNKILIYWFEKKIEEETINKKYFSIIEKLNEIDDELGSDSVLEMINLFLNETDRYLEDIQTPFYNGDFISLKKQCHRIRGVYLNLGIKSAEEIVYKIENHNDKKEIPQLLDSLQIEIKNVNKFVEMKLKEYLIN